MSQFYVYEHWRPDMNSCFYVGKGGGGKGTRMYSIWNRNTYYTRIRNKLKRNGFKIEIRIFAEGLTEREAFDIEKERIAFWRSSGVNLVNMTEGGDGVTPTEETRAKMRAASARRWADPEQKKKASETAKRIMTPDRLKMLSELMVGKSQPLEVRIKSGKSIKKFYEENPEARQERSKRASGEKNPFYGKKHDPETLRRIADKKRGSKMSEETKEKMRIAQAERRKKEAEKKPGIQKSFSFLREPFKHTPETIEKMKIAAKKRGISESTRIAQKLAVTGKKRTSFSKETIENMKIAARKREEKRRLLREAL